MNNENNSELDKRKRSAAKKQELRRQLEARDFLVADATVRINSENKHNSLANYKLNKAKKLVDSLIEDRKHIKDENIIFTLPIKKIAIANKLLIESITSIFHLQQQIWELIYITTMTTWEILEKYGETEIIILVLEQLDNLKSKLNLAYDRLHIILLRVGESQPNAAVNILVKLNQTMAETEVILELAANNIYQIRKDWKLP